MKKVIVGILAAIGVLSILAFFAVVALMLISISSTPSVPSRVVLELDLEGGVIETIPDDPLAQIMLGGALQLRDVVEALERGANDRRVVGVLARISGESMAMAQIQEVRDAILRFRESGKPAIAFAETFGEFGPGNGGYYLATAFDEVYMQPSGDIGLTGLYYETMFLRGAFDKIGLEPRMGQRYEYKNAVNSYTHTSMTEPHREALQRVMESRFSQIVAGIAEARGITEDDVRNLAERGPLIGEEALDAGLVDSLSYRDQIMDSLREKTSERARLLYADQYLERAGRPHTRGTQVALIHGYGGVARGPSRYSPIDGTIIMGSETVTQAFRAAIDNDRIEAILFRVDSPGGSYVASDTIWRETVRAREAGKPVIVSMGNLAGSGGYFVAMAADRIVAHPGTITASIGVYGGKMLTNEFWKKLGISFDGVATNPGAKHWSSHSDYDEAGNERLEASLDRIYEDFTGKVAEGRGLPLERVREIAKGRIWTGEDALELGLVDELGGYAVALDQIRDILDLEEDAPIRLRRYPAQKTEWEALFSASRESSESIAVRSLLRSVRSVQPLIRQLSEAGLVEQKPGLVMEGASGLDN
ncbi:MAG: signal peptide peptidase SppA [Acidobacteria bacterium]|nr:signal peptide peptidase SppA [Acidobacteriota bacterium]NIM64078.1 signal peptide peptidase SppA [Acidobacteriota bacterium]NIO60974.1 signal peptide peptidase SppA [Acidobacteriota bacterium]NIQ31990.1 signal peptide peptidase SppA [Acidobacteriota bacterium]NIQ87486.1 signal peptide peptidase SppA [Acidobacteriota bacterium]